MGTHMATKSPKSSTDKAASKPKPAVASVAAVIAPKSKAAVKATAKPSDKPALKAVTAPKFESKPKAKIEALKRRTLLEAVAMRVGVKRTDARSHGCGSGRDGRSPRSRARPDPATIWQGHVAQR